MEAKNYKIGNYVCVENDKHHPYLKNRTLEVIGIRIAEGIDKVTFKQNFKYAVSIKTTDNPIENSEYNQYLEFIKPIPITDDWLKLLGFIESGAELLYLPMPELKSEIHYEKKPYGNVITLQSSVGMFIPNDISYIHELQNLFFALTGTELILKNKG